MAWASACRSSPWPGAWKNPHVKHRDVAPAKIAQLKENPPRAEGRGPGPAGRPEVMAKVEKVLDNAPKRPEW